MKDRRRAKVTNQKESKVITKNKRTTCITVEPVEDRKDYPFGFGEDDKLKQPKPA